MKKYFVLLSVLVFGMVFILNITPDSDNEYCELIFANAEALAGPGDDGGPGGATGSGDCGGYRQWNVSGVFAARKNFYDCACVLRDGFKPQGDCRGAN